MRMPVIDRSRFQPTDSGGMTGTFAAGGWRFDCHLYAKSGDLDRAWRTCEALVGLLVDRFDEVERAVAGFGPTLNIWAPDDVSQAEAVRRTLEAMGRTEVVYLSVGDAGRGSACFDGPDFVRGHAVQVTAAEDGRLSNVTLAG
jgi:hypothetical protein